MNFPKSILLFIFFTITLFSKELEDVSLLLKWKHSFQFAGYYAALEKGFYEEEGLNVKLIEGGAEKDTISFVTSNNARYSISDSSLLYHYLNNKPVVLISQIFQHSPLVLLSHKKSGIKNPYEMSDKKLVYGNEMIINKLLKDININRIYYNSKSEQDFIEKRVDVIAGYSISTPYIFKEKGVSVNIINPQNFGVDFYGDNLFTSMYEVQNHPERVRKINRATIKGWKYALKNPNEIINLIQEKYSKELSSYVLKNEAKELEKIILPHLLPIGTINKDRYNDLLLEYKQIEKLKNVSIQDDFYFDKQIEKKVEIKKDFDLIKNERDWLSLNSSFKFTGDPSWLPMEAFDENGNYVGIVSDYLKEISRITGIKFDVIPTTSWSQSIQYSKDRTVDILSNTVESYRDDVIFTKPYFKTEIVMVMGKKQSFVNSLDDIKDKKIAIVKDYSYITKVVSKYPYLNYVEVESVEEGLKAVSRGEVDTFLCTLAKASMSIPELSLSNIKIVGKTEFSTELGFAVRSDYRELVNILNKAIDKIEKEKKREIFNKWVKASYIHEKDYSLAIKIIIGSIVIISWFVYIVYRMRKEINLRKELEKSLKNSKREAELANKSKSEFLANMSHEIRTPMNSVIGFSELLKETELNNKQRGYLKSIINSSKNLLDIINDILDLSKIEAGKLTIEKTNMNLKSVLNDVYHVFELTAQQKGLDLELNFSNDIPINIISDELRIRQILINLVGNAIKFTEKGFVKIVVDIKNLKKNRCNISIKVIDSGIGIEDNQKEKIFANFEQMDGQSTRKYGGTGLGLAISTKLAKKLDGLIKLESKIGIGSTFELFLENISYNNEVSDYINSQFEEKTITYNFKNSLVLIVDDIEDNRKLLKEKLTNNGINFLEATNGKEAVDIVLNSTEKIDLVFMDIRMPVMNGYEALEIIKSNKNYKELPIIAVTASILKKEQEKMLKKGFYAFLEKPINHEKYINILSTCIECDIVEEKLEDTVSSYELSAEIKKEFLIEFKERLSNPTISNNFKLLLVLENDIKVFAEQRNEQALILICNELKEAIDNFDIEKIKEIVNKLKV